jgi:hypothetical protein
VSTSEIGQCNPILRFFQKKIETFSGKLYKEIITSSSVLDLERTAWFWKIQGRANTQSDFPPSSYTIDTVKALP